MPSIKSSQLKVLLTSRPRLYQLVRLPYAASRYALRRPHDPDYGVFGLFPERRGLFLDVGANAGQSAFSFRLFRPDNWILSVEPNPFHRRDLVFAGRLVRRFRFLIAGAGMREEERQLHVPVYRGVPLTAEASLDPEAIRESRVLRRQLGTRMELPEFELVTRTVSIRPLDCLGLAPDFIKLDVQGHEHQALLGLRETLRRSWPVLLIEAPDEGVRSLLDDFGYVAYRYDADRGGLRDEDGPATNVVFLKPGLP